MNMQENNDFQGIGKKTPYKVPASFFENISEKTLLKAKQREQKRKKSMALWRTMAVAASVVAVFFLGTIISDPDIKQETSPMVRDIQSVEQQLIQNEEIVKHSEDIEIKKAIPEKVNGSTIVEEKDSEKIGDILADLSDEELLQLAAMYKTDPFISESEQ